MSYVCTYPYYEYSRYSYPYAASYNYPQAYYAPAYYYYTPSYRTGWYYPRTTCHYAWPF